MAGKPSTETDMEWYERMIYREPMSGCWLWTGYVATDGYARLGGLRAKRLGTTLVHRASYLIHVGRFPEDRDLDHLCRTRCCSNPAHLEPVTRSVNVRRGVSIAASHARKTHCPGGHPYDDANTYWQAGRRRCRTCRRAANYRRRNELQCR